MYLYKTPTFPHQPLKSISEVALLHRFNPDNGKYVVLEKTKMVRFISFAHLMHLHLLNWFNTPLIAVAGGM